LCRPEVTLTQELRILIITLVPTDILGISFSRNKSAQIITKDILDLTNELSVWIFANGEGLPKKKIDAISSILKEKLRLWSSVSTKNIITLYSTLDQSTDITQRDLINILQTRKNDDPEAKEFISKQGGSFVSAVFGKKEEPPMNSSSNNLPSNTNDFMSFFGATTSNNQQPENPPEEPTIFSAIYDWFQS